MRDEAPADEMGLLVKFGLEGPTSEHCVLQVPSRAPASGSDVPTAQATSSTSASATASQAMLRTAFKLSLDGGTLRT